MRPDFARSAAPTRKFEYGAWAFSRARPAAAIRESYSVMYVPYESNWSFLPNFPLNHIRDARNHGAQERDELCLDALGGFEDFDVVERLVQYSGGHVRHAGNSQDAQAGMACGEDFRHRGHADQVGPDGAQIADLRGRFVTWPRKRGVDAFMHDDAEPFPFL